MSDNKGLYNKYLIIIRESGQEAQGDYFVLKPSSDPAARAALVKYADQTANHELAKDIYEWLYRLTGPNDPDAYQEEVYPMLDGSEIIRSQGDRVLFHRMHKGQIPITIDPESVIDDVLNALEFARLENRCLIRSMDFQGEVLEAFRTVLAEQIKGKANEPDIP
jgi:hypothetical protein